MRWHTSMALAVLLLVITTGVCIAWQQTPAAGAAPQGVVTPVADAPARGAGGRGGRGAGGGGGARGTPLGDGPWDIGEGENRVHVTVVTKGLDHPWGMAILPNGDMLVTERGIPAQPHLRVIRKGVLDPNPIEGLPQIR